MLKEICIAGAGVVGSGVSQLFAQHGYHINLVDCSLDQLHTARLNILKSLRYQSLSKRITLNESIDDIVARIHFTTDDTVFKTAEFIIENITEIWQQKKLFYQRLKTLCSGYCILGVNTSAIPITKIAALMDNPSCVIGMHFMSPVPLMPLVELIKGYHTSPETIQTAQCHLDAVERNYLVVNDSPGFVTNRAMMLFVNEAIFMADEKIASVEEIDILFRQCFGHKMGPLQTADLIGLDTVLYSLNVLYEEFNDAKYKPCPLLKKMVYAGLHGEKTKEGFYCYE